MKNIRINSFILSNEIVKCSFLPFLTGMELDILLILFVLISKENYSKVKIKRIEIQRILEKRTNKSINKVRFNNSFQSLFDKIESHYLKLENSKFKYIPLLEYDGECVSLNSHYYPQFIRFRPNNEGYIYLKLNEILNLKNNYEKLLYIYLRKYKNTGKLVLEENHLIEYLNPPSKYTIKRFTDRILDPSIKSLSKYFPNLRYEKLDNPKKGTTNFLFYFIRLNKKEETGNKYKSQDLLNKFVNKLKDKEILDKKTILTPTEENELKTIKKELNGISSQSWNFYRDKTRENKFKDEKIKKYLINLKWTILNTMKMNGMIGLKIS